MTKKKVCYTASDGKMVIILKPAEEGGYVVSCPFDPELCIQGDTLEEAFEMAYDAAALLKQVRKELHHPAKPRRKKNTGPNRNRS